MDLKLGYLLPTRENIMQDRPSGRLLIDAAKRAAELGYDSIWAGDSLLARPRHDPLTLLAAVAGAVPRVEVGTAVLLPALRNPIALAQQLATIDQVSEGRLIVGAGIAADTPTVRAEFAAVGVPFEKRVGRMMEGFRLCKALWSGEAIDWDGRWQLSQGVLAPTPYRPGGPPIWIGTGVRPGIERTAKHFDGWFPIGPNPETFARRRQLFLETATAAGRDTDQLATALYLTVAVMDDAEAADDAINTYLQNYYGAPPAMMRKIQACFGGPLEQVLDFIRAYVTAGAEHIVLRFVGDHEKLMQTLANHRSELSG
jgi:alkanesulfonate monooxygenase SsuD/methylene tetrahydromethanopterin reductase-like flavin-dependent oxidoreductase (luciferase family)